MASLQVCLFPVCIHLCRVATEVCFQCLTQDLQSQPPLNSSAILYNSNPWKLSVTFYFQWMNLEIYTIKNLHILLHQPYVFWLPFTHFSLMQFFSCASLILFIGLPNCCSTCRAKVKCLIIIGSLRSPSTVKKSKQLYSLMLPLYLVCLSTWKKIYCSCLFTYLYCQTLTFLKVDIKSIFVDWGHVIYLELNNCLLDEAFSIRFQDLFSAELSKIKGSLPGDTLPSTGQCLSWELGS